MLGSRSSQEWIAEYSQGHQNKLNRALHSVGIPLIALSVLMFFVSPFVHDLWKGALGLFVFGWVLQFIGHAFEGKPPEFFKDPRFLLVGLRWWFAKMAGRA